jgi:hypothetical protein
VPTALPNKWFSAVKLFWPPPDPSRPNIECLNTTPIRKWIRQGEELELAKDCEAIAERGLKEMAKRRRKEEEKMRMLREVAELFMTDWPVRKREAATDSKSAKSEG